MPCILEEKYISDECKMSKQGIQKNIESGFEFFDNFGGPDKYFVIMDVVDKRQLELFIGSKFKWRTKKENSTYKVSTEGNDWRFMTRKGRERLMRRNKRN